MKHSDIEKYLEKSGKGGDPQPPRAHIVLGSGFGLSLGKMHSNWSQCAELGFDEVSSLHIPSVPDHAGRYVFYRHKESGSVVCFQVGRLHGYEGIDAQKVVQPVMLARLAGVSDFILTNASGALTAAYVPGDV